MTRRVSPVGRGGFCVFFVCFVAFFHGAFSIEYFDTYGSVFEGHSASFLVRCFADVGESCSGIEIELGCSDAQCPSCLANSDGETCDGETRITLPDTEVYFTAPADSASLVSETLTIYLGENTQTNQTLVDPTLVISVVDYSILPVPEAASYSVVQSESLEITLGVDDAENLGYEIFIVQLPLSGTLRIREEGSSSYTTATQQTNGEPTLLEPGTNVFYDAPDDTTAPDFFFFGTQSASDVIGGGLDSASYALIEITIETKTVQGSKQQAEIWSSTLTTIEIEVDNPTGVTFSMRLNSEPEGTLYISGTSSEVEENDVFSSTTLDYMPYTFTDQYDSDYFDFFFIVSGDEVGFGSFSLSLAQTGAPTGQALALFNVTQGSPECIDLYALLDTSLVASEFDFYITALPHVGEIDDDCEDRRRGEKHRRGIITKPQKISQNYFTMIPSETQTGSYTTSIEWTAVEEDTGLSTPPYTIYFSVSDLDGAVPTAISTSISIRQDSEGLIYLTGYSPSGNSLVPAVSFCLNREAFGVLYQTTDPDPDADDEIACDKGLGPQVVLGEDGTVLYRAQPGQPIYTYNFRFVMQDGDIQSTPASVFVFVQENQRPIAIGGSFEGNEDTILVIDRSQGSGWGSDPNGDRLTTYISRPPQKGTIYQYCIDDDDGSFCTGDKLEEAKILVFEPVQLTDSLNRMLFQPQADASGLPYDAFSFIVKDDLFAESNEQRIIISITQSPDKPVARDIVLVDQKEDTDFPISLLGDDPDGEALSSTVVTLPTKGVLYQYDDRESRSNPIAAGENVTDSTQRVWYESNPDENGDEFFTFYVNDVLSRSDNTGSVSFYLAPVNDPPLVANETVNIEYYSEQIITLEVIDIDGDETEAIILVLPENGRLSQVDEGQSLPLGTIAQTPAPLQSSDHQVAFSATGDVSPSSTVTFVYNARDKLSKGLSLKSLLNGTVTLEISADNRPTSSGGLSIAVVIGVVVAVVVVVLCCCLYYYRWRKKQEAKKKSLVGLLRAKSKNKDSWLLLENLILEDDLTVVKALAEVITISDGDDFGDAMIGVFHAKKKEMHLIKHFIRVEVEEAEDPGTLFRGNCIASKVLKAYSKEIGIEYLHSTVGVLMPDTLANVGAYEVDTRKMKEGQDINENWERLKMATQMYLEAITESEDKCPYEFREVCHFLLGEVEKRFPDYKNSISYVGGFLFLRFFCPAMVSPEGYGLVDSVPTLEERRGLVLISKAIQNLSNGVQFGQKEEYMGRMNEFIVRNLDPTKEFLERIATLPEGHDERNSGDAPPEEEKKEAEKVKEGEDMGQSRKDEALGSVYRLLFVNKDDLIDILQKEDSNEVDAAEAKKPLEEFERLLSLEASDWKQIRKIIVKNLPIIRAFCSSIQSADVAQSLITIFEAKKMTITVLSELIRMECEEASDPQMILRGNGTAFKMLKGYVEIIGLGYLQETLGMMVRFVCNSPEGYEIDIARCEEGTTEEEIKENVNRLNEAFSEFWAQILQTAYNIPIQIRILCRQLFDQISKVCPERRYNIVGDFIFNRMLGPAIVNPLDYGLMDEEPSPEARRALVLVTKVILNVVHGIKVHPKDCYAPLSDLTLEYAGSLQAFLDQVISVDARAIEEVKQAYEITPALLEESVLTVFYQMKDDITKADVRESLKVHLRETGGVVDRLQYIFKDLGVPDKKQKKVNRLAPRAGGAAAAGGASAPAPAPAAAGAGGEGAGGGGETPPAE